MSAHATKWAWSQNLPMGPKFTLLALADYADGDGVCFPGQVRLSAKLGCGERTVRGHVKYLEDAGVIQRRERRRLDGSRTSDEYRLVGMPPEDSAGSEAGVTGKIRQGHRQILQSSPADSAGHELVSRTTRGTTSNTSTSSASPTSVEFDKFEAAWNDNRGPLPAVSKLSEKRKRGIRSLVKEHGADAALVMLREATRAVAENQFWRERKYGFDNLVPGKVLTYAERRRSARRPTGGFELGETARHPALGIVRIVGQVGGELIVSTGNGETSRAAASALSR